MFSVISAPLIERRAFWPDKRKIVPDTGELAIMRHEAVKGLLLIKDKPYSQSAVCCALVYKGNQRVLHLAFNWLICIGTHRMPLFHCFHQIHSHLLHSSPLLSGTFAINALILTKRDISPFSLSASGSR